MAGQRDESGHFWDLLTQLGQCHQAEIDSLKSTCISSHGLPDDFTTDKASLMESHHESIELALTCMGQNEVHVPAVRSSSEGNRGLTRSLSEASIVSVCERSGAPCTSRPSMRVSHTLTGRSQILGCSWFFFRGFVAAQDLMSPHVHACKANPRPPPSPPLSYCCQGEQLEQRQP